MIERAKSGAGGGKANKSDGLGPRGSIFNTALGHGGVMGLITQAILDMIVKRLKS